MNFVVLDPTRNTTTCTSSVRNARNERLNAEKDSYNTAQVNQNTLKAKGAKKREKRNNIPSTQSFITYVMPPEVSLPNQRPEMMRESKSGGVCHIIFPQEICRDYMVRMNQDALPSTRGACHPLLC